MLEIIIVIAIYSFLQKWLDSPYKKKIQESTSTEEAIKYRKKLRRTRLLFFIIFFSLYIGVSILSVIFTINSSSDNKAIEQGIKGLVLGIYFLYRTLFKDKKYDDLKGNVSTFTKTEYLENNQRFAIFLRGFDDDKYAKFTDIQKTHEFESFSEYHFMSLLENRIPVCAIGMTKETDSPYGASRIYVDDDCWKNDVRELMEKAEEIYILVSDRDSCIWEIEQSIDMLDKTTFIIDNPDKYENARAILTKSISLPELPATIQQNPHQILQYRSGQFSFSSYQNDVSSYAQLLNVPAPKMKKKSFNKKGCLWLVAIIAITISLIFVMQLCSEYNSYNSYDDEYYVGDTIEVDTVEEATYTVFADDGSCSVVVPVYFEKMSNDTSEGAILSLSDGKNTLGITINLEPKKELKQFGIKKLNEYVDAIAEQNKSLLMAKVIKQETLNHCIKTEYRANVLNHDIFIWEDCSELDKQFLRITLICTKTPDDELPSMFEDIVQSFQLLEDD